MRDTFDGKKINHCRIDACGWHPSTAQELKVVSFALIKSVACAVPALGHVCVMSRCIALSELAFVIIRSSALSGSLALAAHSCWSNIRLAAE